MVSDMSVTVLQSSLPPPSISLPQPNPPSPPPPASFNNFHFLTASPSLDLHGWGVSKRLRCDAYSRMVLVKQQGATLMRVRS